MEIYSLAAADVAVDWRTSPVRSLYSNQIQRIAPQMLAGRDRELAELAAFTTSDDEPGYLWLRAGAWSGKTALLSWFALHPPAGVRVVSFFVTARLAGQSDRSAFVDNVMEQLLAMLGQQIPSLLTETTREVHLLALLDEAAQACHSRGEIWSCSSTAWTRTGECTRDPTATASPRYCQLTHHKGLRIIVADRSNTTLPADVPAHHSLRIPGIVRPLNPSTHALWQNNRRTCSRISVSRPAIAVSDNRRS